MPSEAEQKATGRPEISPDGRFLLFTPYTQQVMAHILDGSPRSCYN